MASDYKVCIVAQDDTLNSIEEILRNYDHGSEEVQQVINSDSDSEFHMPTCIDTESIKQTESALWFEARRYCSDKLFIWIAKQLKLPFVYAVYDDCGNDVYYVSGMNAMGKDKYLGVIDAYKYCGNHDEEQLLESEFIKLKMENLESIGTKQV